MKVVADGQDAIVHLDGAGELDVLLIACSDTKTEFARPDRRRLQRIARQLIAPLVRPPDNPEIFLAGQDALVALRAMHRFAECVHTVPPGLPTSVLREADGLQEQLKDALQTMQT